MKIHPVSRRPVAAAVVLVSALCAIACSGGESSPDASVPLAERVTLEGFSFQPPTSWKTEAPTSTMRLAQYRIEPAPGDTDPGECALFHFPGSGGSVQANIDRWIGQFEQPDGSASADHASVERFTNEGLNISFVDVSGTYTGAGSGMATPAEPKQGYRMVAGVVETAQGPWFMKCTGPSATMAATGPGLKAMLKSARG
jgi:hypothetical protein